MASISRLDRDGKPSYIVRWREADGTQRKRYFPRMTDARRFQVEVEDSKYRGAYVNPSAGKVALREQAARWYAATAALKPATRADYRSLLDCHVLPRFGTVPLHAVDTLAVREWVASMVQGGLGAKRAGKALQVLHQVLGSAVESGRLARNAAAGISPPRQQRREAHFLDAAQVEALAGVAAPPYGVLVRVAAYSGLRPCELVALRRRHLDVLRATIRVAEAAPEVRGRLAWGGVKTHEARTARLPRSVASELGAYLATRPADPAALVFCAARGGPIRESKWVPTIFKPAVRAAGLPEGLRFYDLRHTCASLLIRSGASIKAVQKHMGHATAAITLDVYGHLFPDELPALAERLEALRATVLEGARAQGAPQVRPSSAPAVVPIAKGAGR